MNLDHPVAPVNCPEISDLSRLKEEIDDAVLFRVTGRVSAVSGESIELEGLTVPLGAICQVTTQTGKRLRGRVIGFRGVRPLLAPLELLESVTAGDRVELIEKQQHLLVGDSLCGRVLDAFGQPIDGRPLARDLYRVRAEQKPPATLDRPPISEPLETGVRVIDGLLTCGRGQRIGIFAGSGVGKSTLLGMLANACKADRIVIAMVGERGREVKEFIQHCLGDMGLSRSVVVVATSDAPAAQRVSAAWTATSIAESFRDQGHHVLLLFDSVTRFATAQRELGLAAGEPPTTRGFPPSVFQSLPRLVERAGCSLKGAITAFYTVLVEGDDHQEPIADSLRSLLDGHLVLTRELAEESHYPPIDPLQSISRLQPKLVDQNLVSTVGKVRRLLADYRKHADLIAIGAYRQGTDPRIDSAISMHDRYKSFAIQDWRDTTSLREAQKMIADLSLDGEESNAGVESESVSRYDPIGTSVDL